MANSSRGSHASYRPDLPATASPVRDGAGRAAPQVVISVKGSADYGAWLDDLAEHQRIKVVDLVDHALVHYAKHVGFDRPTPPRYPRR